MVGDHVALLRGEEVLDVGQVADVREGELAANEVVGPGGEVLVENGGGLRDGLTPFLEDGFVTGAAEQLREERLVEDLPRGGRELRLLDADPLLHHPAVFRGRGRELLAVEGLVEVAADRARLVKRKAVVLK